MGDPSLILGLGRSSEEGIGNPLQHFWASVAQMVKKPPAMREIWLWSLGWEDPLEEGMATHSSILTLRIPKDRGAWHTRLQSMGCKESNNTLCLSIAQHTYIQASQVLLVVKNLPANAGDKRCGFEPWEGMVTYSIILCLESLLDRGVWWATVHRVAKSQTWSYWARTYIYPLFFGFPSHLGHHRALKSSLCYTVSSH